MPDGSSVLVNVKWLRSAADEIERLRAEAERQEFFLGYLNGDQESMAAGDWNDRQGSNRATGA